VYRSSSLLVERADSSNVQQAGPSGTLSGFAGAPLSALIFKNLEHIRIPEVYLSKFVLYSEFPE
jgi:hypothetical protein